MILKKGDIKGSFHKSDKNRNVVFNVKFLFDSSLHESQCKLLNLTGYVKWIEKHRHLKCFKFLERKYFYLYSLYTLFPSTNIMVI